MREMGPRAFEISLRCIPGRTLLYWARGGALLSEAIPLPYAIPPSPPALIPVPRAPPRGRGQRRALEEVHREWRTGDAEGLAMADTLLGGYRVLDLTEGGF